MASDIRDMKGRRQKDLLWQKRVYKDPSGYKEMKRLYRMLDQLLRAGPSRKTFDYSRRPGTGGSAQQLCIVKARTGSTVKAHRKFLLEYLPQENKTQVKEKPRLFGNAGDDGKDPAAGYQAHMTGRHFKFIISPENQKADAEALVRTLIKRMEAATGFKFSWIAAAHTDTAHKHAHLLINGRDQNGREVWFDPAFIKSTMREMAREICTAMTGPRSPEEIRQSRENLHKALRYTSIDEDLKNFERPYDGENPQFESRLDAREDVHYKRLVFLAGLGLAEQDGNNRQRFYLEKGWRNKLKTQGRYNSYLTARQELMHAAPYNLEQYDKDTGPIEGQVTKIYKMNDEDRWNHAMVIENKTSGRAWYVPLYYEPRGDLLGKTVQCRAGKNERGQMRPAVRQIGAGGISAPGKN